MSDQTLDLNAFLGNDANSVPLLCGKTGCDTQFSHLHPNEVKVFYAEPRRVPHEGKGILTPEDIENDAFLLVKDVMVTTIDRDALDGRTERCDDQIDRGVMVRLLFGCEICGGETALFFHFHKGSTFSWSEYRANSPVLTGDAETGNDAVRTMWRE
jgi:hypothetical protein